MTKELEALYRIANARNHLKYDTLELVEKDFQIVQQALQRLEAIDNANPSEALKKYLKWLERQEFFIKISEGEYVKCIDIIKPALQKAQEQEKVLKIIFEKGLPLAERDMIKHSENYEQYQIKISWWNYKPFAIPKSKEEFELLKRYVNE